MREKLRYLAIIGLLLTAVAIPINIATSAFSRYVEINDQYDDWKADTQTKKQVAANKIAAGCVKVLKRGAPLERCLAHQIEAYQAQENTDQDLKSQRDMAWWAMLSFYVSLFSAVSGATGLIFLWLSLRQTRQAITTDRELGEAQVRAYLSVEIPNPPEGASITVDENYKVDLIIRNTGQSPARNMRYIAGVIIRETKLTAGDGFPIYVDPSVQSAGTPLPAGGADEVVANMARGLNDDTINAAMQADKPFYLCAYVEYKDVFNKDRHVWFCAELLMQPGLFQEKRDSIFPVYRWTMTHSHNHAD